MNTKTSMYGFGFDNPLEITGPGQFVSAPPKKRVTTVTKYVNTTAHIDHDTNIFTHCGPWDGHYTKVCIMSLDFHWESLKDLKAEKVPIDVKYTWQHGLTTTDIHKRAMSRTLGAEGGGEAKGLSLKLSASITETNSSEHMVAITDQKTEEFEYTCPANTTMQLWQLVATFTYNEVLHQPDVGCSIDYYIPPYQPGTRMLVVPTSRLLFNTFPR
jgi:hypothetical protein